MKVIIFERPDGGVSIMYPVEQARLLNEADGAFIARIVASDIPNDASNVTFVDANEIPIDRTFRNAWTLQAGKIEHNLPKCKIIAHDKCRIARAKEFAPLDIEVTIPAKAAAAEAKRQAIRDKYDAAQASIEAAGDVHTLEIIVAELPIPSLS